MIRYHSQVYSTAWECVRMIRYDSFSEIPELRRDELDGIAKQCRREGKKEEIIKMLHRRYLEVPSYSRYFVS